MFSRRGVILVSRKNINYKAQQDAKRVPHYGIRKLSIGVASVLLGTVFYMQNGTAHADVNPTVSTGNDSVNVVNKDFGTSGSPVASNTSTGASSVNSAGSMVSAGDATNLTVPSQALVSPVEGVTNQSNNAVLAASEPESTSSVGQVNVGTDNSNSISSLPPASHHQAAPTSSSQQASNVAQNNNALAYSQEQQTSSFNVNNDGKNNVQGNAVLYNDNKVSQESTISGDASNVSMMVTPKWTTGYGMRRADVDLSFDISHDQFQNLDRVYLGNLTTDKASSAGYRMAMSLNGGQYRDIVDGGVHFGKLLWKGYGQDPTNDSTNTGYVLYLVLDKNATSSLIGSKHFSLHLPKELNLNLYTTPKAFCDNGVLSTNITFTIGNKTSDLAHLDLRSFPNYPAESELKSDFDLNNVVSNSFNSSLSRGNINEWGSFPHVDDWNSYVKNGFNFSNLKLRSKLQNAMKISANQGFSVNGGQQTGIFRVFSFWDNGKQSTESDELPMTIWGGVPTIRMDDNLSLGQLKSFDLYGMTYSYQRDGSVLVYTNIDTNRLLKSVNWDLLRHELDTRSYVINVHSKDPNKALDNTVNAIKAGVFQFENAVYVQPVNATLPLRLTVQQLDLNTGAAVGQPDVSQTVPATTVAKDPSTVKLHVITPSGVALQQVKSFTDWPDQNKHVSLTIPLITGYHLVSNPSQILSQLHLSGTAISSSTSVNYPAENTVADYYVVMAPDTESVRVNITDSDENSTLSSYALSGDYGSVIMPTSDLSTRLESLLSSGKYDLVTNPLTDSPKYSTTNSPITISLKHHIDSTQRHYRVIEDLPDGTKKVIIDMEATLYKDANTDKWQQDFAYLDGDFTKKVLMSDSYKLNVGQQADDGLPDFLKADIDKVSGYDWNLVDGTVGYQDGLFVGFYNSDEKNAGEIYMDLFNGSAKALDVANNVASIFIFPSHDFHIIYTPRSYPVTVNYYDIDGKLVDSVTSMHKFGDTVSIAPVAPANYVLASGQAKVDYLTGLGLNEVDFLVEPKLTTTAETKMVSRTIRVQTPDGRMNDVVQTVTFVRNSYLNQVTKQATYSPWSFGGRYQFSGYQPKPMNGYTADVVPAVIVTPDSLDTTANVVYHKIPVVYEIDYRLANGTVVKNVSVTPESDGTIHLTAPQGYRLLTTVPDVQVGHSSQKLSVLVLPNEQTYTAYSALPSVVTEPLTKTITRTINITMPNGRVRRVVQQVHFVRTATVVANGKITYSNWTGVGQMSFDRLFVPKRRGYRLVMTNNQDQTLIGVNQMVVDPTMDNVVINVKYVK